MMHGFKIIGNQRSGYQLQDRDTFNNWGKLAITFKTREAAETYAWAAYEFKTGQRMTLADPT